MVKRELFPVFKDSVAMKKSPPSFRTAFVRENPSVTTFSKNMPSKRTLFGTVAIWIDRMNRQIVVRFREFPAAIFFAFHGGLVREKLLFNFAAMSGGRYIFVGDYDAVFPPGVFPRVISRPEDRIRGHVTEFLLAVQGGDLIFLEELPEFVRVTPFYF